MAIKTGLGVFTGKNHEFEFMILADDERTVEDITGWELSFVVRPDEDSETELLSKTTDDGITISGTYHSSPNKNTQLAVVAISAGNTSGMEAQHGVWELINSETDVVLGYGPFVFTRSLHD